MRKLAAFIPAIVCTIFYGWVALVGGMGSFSPMVVVWLALLWVAGVLLNKVIWWGGLFGIVTGACFIYMGTQETGQIMRETPFGVILLLYYAACSYFVYKKSGSKMK
ncbi:hypothetical protein [Clostridium sp. D33t1_170424_F3]|uniref:hypothetical protein n=1 Tax=Clostridium sp. D33t1_170424_F3 TaxID=2787099 RepID=UPI0018AC0D29|nr:hypothetical protein [Clostridium sp. D33t1_170424_F3]